jgi:hypothetical protein
MQACTQTHIDTHRHTKTHIQAQTQTQSNNKRRRDELARLYRCNNATHKPHEERLCAMTTMHTTKHVQKPPNHSEARPEPAIPGSCLQCYASSLLWFCLRISENSATSTGPTISATIMETICSTQTLEYCRQPFGTLWDLHDWFTIQYTDNHGHVNTK